MDVKYTVTTTVQVQWRMRHSCCTRSGHLEQVLESLEQEVKSRKLHVEENTLTNLKLWKMQAHASAYIQIN